MYNYIMQACSVLPLKRLSYSHFSTKPKRLIQIEGHRDLRQLEQLAKCSRSYAQLSFSLAHTQAH